MTAQPKKNNLDYIIDPTSRIINRSKTGNNDPTSNYFDNYYISLVEIKGFNALIDNKPYFD